MYVIISNKSIFGGHKMKECIICGKKPRVFYQLSHSHRRTKRRWSPNLQRKKVLYKGKLIKGNICTACLGSKDVQLPPVLPKSSQISQHKSA